MFERNRPQARSDEIEIFGIQRGQQPVRWRMNERHVLHRDADRTGPVLDVRLNARALWRAVGAPANGRRAPAFDAL
jgi:hypothetical protein